MTISKVHSASLVESISIDTDVLVVDGVNNRVGIGNASPATPLHINGVPGTSTLRLDAGGTLNGSRRNWGISAEKYAAGSLTIEHGSAEGAAPSNAAMTIDSSGRVTMPSQPCAFAYKTGGGNSTSASGAGVLDVVGTNVGNHFNTSNGRFTCPVAGNYLVTWTIMNSQGNTGTSTCVFRVNGVGYKYFHVENSHPQGQSDQVIYSASAGDYFDFSHTHFHFNGGSTFKYPSACFMLIG